MAPPSETPIIIGVGDIKNKSARLEDAKEPAQLMHEAILAAIRDSGASNTAELQAAIDSIDVVKTWTWPYPDLPGLLAQKLGVDPKHALYSEHGGDKPGKLFDDAAKRITRGESRVAVVTGGEALASLSACAAAKKLPPPGWTNPSQAVDSVFTPTGRDLGDNLGAIHEIGAPIHVYPLYENALRARRGQSIEDNNEESAALYAEFSKVAEQNPVAWNYGKSDDAKVIGTVGKKNRMICFPYPLLMNAFNTVNLSSALVLTTPTFATSLSIPRSKWIYPLGGAGTSDASEFWHRPNFFTSPSISRSLDAALTVSHIRNEEVDLFDFYSCFPVVPKLAARHLGLDVVGSKKPLTLLGGLTSFGGAGNNYSMHALTEMTRQLRRANKPNSNNDKIGKKGLVLCNGGVLSYQYVIILSSSPPPPSPSSWSYPQDSPLPAQITDLPSPEIEYNPQGEATVETYTVEFSRDGKPAKGFVVGRLEGSGKRFLANCADERTLAEMSGGEGKREIVGSRGWVSMDERGKKKGRAVFLLGERGRANL